MFDSSLFTLREDNGMKKNFVLSHSMVSDDVPRNIVTCTELYLVEDIKLSKDGSYFIPSYCIR